MPNEFLSRATAGGGQFLDAFFLQAGAQFGFAAVLGTITLVTGTHSRVERAVMLAGARRHKIGNADIDADHCCIQCCFHLHFFIIGKCEPPYPVTLIELHTAVELLRLPGLGVREDFLVVGSEFDGYGNGLWPFSRVLILNQ